MAEESGELVTIDQAAARLGAYPGTIRRRIKRGELRARRGNRGQWLVELPPTPEVHRALDRAPTQAESELVAELRATIHRLERELGDAKAREQQVLTLLSQALAERRQPERRPWPGLRRWFRRVWEGEG